MNQLLLMREMAHRMGLSKSFASKMFLISTRAYGLDNIDMVRVAQAIKYAGENKHLIKPEYR